jgi:hypothetical protein
MSKKSPSGLFLDYLSENNFSLLSTGFDIQSLKNGRRFITAIKQNKYAKIFQATVGNRKGVSF